MTRRRPASRPRRPRGFTLLEVLIALTICATSLAILFSVIAGSKRLTFRANGAIKRGDEVRQLVSLTRLVDQTAELLVEPPDPGSDYRIDLEGEELDVPTRKTSTTTQAIRQYEIQNADGDVLYRGYYWITLEEPE